ncbi:uncharacterized protein ASPGLDRAFT_43021 [Aspergillus glaucus CBS 516.65]|uniref:Uncharacterized protein n=1 Tax=Aspergillus glaucus CBS 516.65 TaxID=1160497 RepID=A0A1L9VVM0_ASPGL|nr:hypothetical protein ASPGLDRAFT_43021 [Aspergillus glaucus CBS 516.65]OJJ87946.1 hypothetical protein ASPGLDRAFT_43021 [Aspergillus glaucus CBS 516.65]
MSTLAFVDVPVTLRACTRYPCHVPLILHLPRSPRAPTSPLSSVSNRLDMEPVQSPSSETYDPEPSTIQRHVQYLRPSSNPFPRASSSSVSSTHPRPSHHASVTLTYSPSNGTSTAGRWAMTIWS